MSPPQASRVPRRAWIQCGPATAQDPGLVSTCHSQMWAAHSGTVPGTRNRVANKTVTTALGQTGWLREDPL